MRVPNSDRNDHNPDQIRPLFSPLAPLHPKYSTVQASLHTTHAHTHAHPSLIPPLVRTHDHPSKSPPNAHLQGSQCLSLPYHQSPFTSPPSPLPHSPQSPPTRCLIISPLPFRSRVDARADWMGWAGGLAVGPGTGGVGVVGCGWVGVRTFLLRYGNK